MAIGGKSAFGAKRAPQPRPRAARRRRSTLAALTAAELRELLAQGPAVIYACEPGRKYAPTFITDSLREQLGYEPEAFLQEPGFWAAHVHPRDRKRLFSEIERGLAAGHLVCQYRFRHKNGGYRWMYDELKVIRDGGGRPVKIIGYWVDITALRDGRRTRLGQPPRADIAARLDRLTRREREVLELVVAGLSNKGVAGRLGISPRTVEVYRARVMEKMGAPTFAALVRTALEGGCPVRGPEARD